MFVACAPCEEDWERNLAGCGQHSAPKLTYISSRCYNIVLLTEHLFSEL
jgi:hypothetical protein